MAPDQETLTACVLSKALGEPVAFRHRGAVWVAAEGEPMPYRLWIVVMAAALHDDTSFYKAQISSSDLNERMHKAGIAAQTRREEGSANVDFVSRAASTVALMFRKIREGDDPAGRIVAMLRRVEDEHASLAGCEAGTDAA